MKIMVRICLLFFLAAGVVLPNLSLAKSADSDVKQLKSRISAVTVYSDRAQVTRTATERLAAGEYRLVFDNLPMGLQPGSIQVNGTGNAVLSDVKTNLKRYSESADRAQKALLDEKTRLEDQIAQMDGNAVQAHGEKEFMANIAKKLTGVTDKTPAGELDPERWVKMVDFYRNRNLALDREIRNIGIARRNLEARLEKVNRQIADLGSSEQKSAYQVEVLVRMKKAGALSLKLSYIVHGTSWKPVYDLRVSTREKKLELVYNAVITQNTSEAWDDVAIELSTAQPGIGGQQPELSPWRLNLLEPHPVRPFSAAAPMAAPVAANQMYKMEKSMRAVEKAEPMEEDTIEKPDATVQANATSVVFEIKGRNSIASDNLPHKVTVLMQRFPAEFRYSTAPKLSPHVYLKTKVKNASEFPLLPGVTNIFLDNNFVANAAMNQVAPGEEFWTFLGADSSIRVERKFIKKHQEQEGVFDKKVKLVYEYQTEISNNKKSEEELVLWDQIPISSHQDITVKLVEPQFEKDSAVIKMNEQNYIEWLFTMKPGQKIKVPFVYTVEYPQGKQVTGLE